MLLGKVSKACLQHWCIFFVQQSCRLPLWPLASLPPSLANLVAGRGSYGAVHKARILASGDIVAVKIIPVTEQDEIAAIQKEIAILRECNHPNIVKYYVSEPQ